MARKNVLRPENIKKLTGDEARRMLEIERLENSLRQSKHAKATSEEEKEVFQQKIDALLIEKSEIVGSLDNR